MFDVWRGSTPKEVNSTHEEWSVRMYSPLLASIRKTQYNRQAVPVDRRNSPPSRKQVALAHAWGWVMAAYVNGG